MKPVSVQTVRERINLLETAQSQTGLLSLAGEFELACLRKLLASMTAPSVAALVPVKLNKGALIISAYTTDAINEEPVLCLSKDGVIEAIRAAGYEVATAPAEGKK